MKTINDKVSMYMSTIGIIKSDKTHVSRNITGPTSDHYDTRLRLNRKVTEEDIKNIKEDKMPGFRLIWSKNMESLAKYKNDNTQFTRLVFLDFYYII